MFSQLAFTGLVLAATVSAHTGSSCSGALHHHPEAAASLCHKFEHLQHSIHSAPAGSCPPPAVLPYPEFASPCFAETDYASTLHAACESLKNTPGGATPGSGSQSSSPHQPSHTDSAGHSGHGGSIPSESVSEGASSPSHGGHSPSNGASSPSHSGSPHSHGGSSHGGSSPSESGSSQSQGPITTSSAVVTEM